MKAEKRRLEEEIGVDRERYQSDLAERDFAIDQTQKKYQSRFLPPLEINVLRLSSSGTCSTK